ncbi:MAG: MBL fold metallo-hydrolase, partial [Gammaproteobacteria bacterium]|nr:MBL fold metallo-hydrolase [Gammaproteobacteria bacterium]
MLDHGVPFRLNSRVRRLVAPNPGVMTGPGTNTYLLGDDEIAVLDPGPAIPAHIDAILRTGSDRIRWIVCTHTHPDHSPAWQAVAAATGAEVIGASPADDMFQ